MSKRTEMISEVEKNVHISRLCCRNGLAFSHCLKSVWHMWSAVSIGCITYMRTVNYALFLCFLKDLNMLHIEDYDSTHCSGLLHDHLLPVSMVKLSKVRPITCKNNGWPYFRIRVNSDFLTLKLRRSAGRYSSQLQLRSGLDMLVS